jgi:glutaminase
MDQWNSDPEGPFAQAPFAYVSTGALPPRETMQALVSEAHRRFLSVSSGKVADYIPLLAAADPTLFGIAVVGAGGETVEAGDCGAGFTMQSISKPFIFALVEQALDSAAVRARLGLNATGLPFDSVIAIEMADARAANPMVNAGALVAASLVPGDSADEKWAFMLNGLSRFAGRPLSMDETAFESEMATNKRNRGIAALLDAYAKLACPPDMAVDIYTRQCSVAVTVKDLATMAATLSNGGVNPLTRARVIDALAVKRVLAVLATSGLYERSGEWLYDVGLPGKSGVSGGVITVAPGKGGLAVFAPPLDPAGNSVRGGLVTRFLSDALGLNLFASQPLCDEADC